MASSSPSELEEKARGVNSPSRIRWMLGAIGFGALSTLGLL